MHLAIRFLLVVTPLGLQTQERASREDDPLRGLWKPVHLVADSIDVIDAFNQISRQSGHGVTIAGGQIESKKVSVRFEGLTYWQAVDELCRLHGNLRFSSDVTSSLGLQLIRERWERPWAAYAGPYRFSAHNLVRVREFKYPERRDRTEVTIYRQEPHGLPQSFTWDGKFRGLELTRAESDSGRSLLPLLQISDAFTQSIPTFNSFGNRLTFQLQAVRPTEKAIARLDLVWRQIVLEDFETFVFENPLASVGQTRTCGPYRVTLSTAKSGDRKGQPGYYEVAFLLQVDPSLVPEPERAAFLEIPVEERLTRQGMRAAPSLIGAYSLERDPADRCRVTIRCNIIGSDGMKSFQGEIARKARLVSVPFTLTDLRLPED